jgi:hypothetical protein
MNRVLKSLLLCCAATTAAAACAHRATDQGAVTTTSAEPYVTVLSNEGAIERIAAAACEHQASCADGTGAQNPDECLRSTAMQARETLGNSTCPSGVDPRRLEGCLTVLSGGSCDPRPLSSIDACDPTVVCVSLR